MKLSSHRVGFAVVCCTLAAISSAAAQETPSALESGPKGWTDLLADGLKGWKRVSIPPNSALKPMSPWSVRDVPGEGKHLVCDGVGYHEMLLYDRECGDGVFHVEWRFREVEGKKGYNSGVYARNSADGKVWHQAQVGSKNVGFFFGDTLVDGQLKRIHTKATGPQRGKEAGAWNTFEITCKGPIMSLWINGAVTSVWGDCQVPRGYVGLEAEGWAIEFKNLRFKD